MPEKVIPLADHRTLTAVPAIPARLEQPNGLLLDTLSRPLHDLRISVTDRCNFRCVYCMPKEIYGRGYQFLRKDQLLTFEELARLAAIFAGLGTQKIRLTGGEPLMRRGLDGLVRMLADIPGVDLTL